MRHLPFACGPVAVFLIVAVLSVVGCKGGSHLEKQHDENEIEWTFDSEKPGGLPKDWYVAETAGQGTTAAWEIVADGSAPSEPNVVAITETENYGHTFNMLIAEGTRFKDLEVEVKVKAIAGEEDQGGGPVWRVKDADNYYIARWNPLENNFRVYFVKDGHRKQIGSAHIEADAGAWHEIEIEHRGYMIIAEFDDEKLIEVEDDTFTEAGKVGLWTKADALTAFDDFEVEEEKAETEDD